MAIQMTAKERLQAKAKANKQLQDQAREKVKSDPGLLDRLREEERERQANAKAAEVRAQRSGSIDPEQVNKTPVQDRARMTRQNSPYQLGDVRSKQGRVGAAAQGIGLGTMASVQYLGETAKQANQNTREYLNTQAAEDYAAAVSEFNRIRSSHWEGTPEYQAAFDRVQEARKALEQTSEEVRGQTVDPNSKGSQMMAESQELKEKALEGTTGAKRLLGETAISMASNLSKLPLGAAAPALMGAEAAAGKAYELQQQGVGAGQALGRGVTSGVIEGITEKMGIDNLFDLVKTGGKTAVKNVLKQAGVEGTEEGFSYVFNLLADKVAKDPNAQFNWDELLQSIASGAISGLFFGAAGTAANRGQADPGVITQTGKEKQAPNEGSLHLASDGKVTLPNAEVNTENAEANTENEKANTENEKANTENALELPVREIKTPENKGDRSVRQFTKKDYQKYYPTSTKAQGLPLPRRESLQEALTASVTRGRTLGENERRTGLPLPSAVEGQLEALEALTTPLDNDDYDVNVIRKYMGEDAALYWLEHKGEEAGDLETGRPKPEQSTAVTDEQGNVVGTQATEKLGVRIEGSLADMGKVQKAREAQWGLDAANKQIEKAEKDLNASAAEKRMAESVAKGIDTLDSFKYGWDGRDNRRRSVVEQLAALYRLRDTYDRNAVKALGRHNKDVFIDKLNKEILNHLDKATPPKGLSLWTNTWERNNLRTWGRELGTKVNEIIFDPIRRNEANRIRWLDKQADDMKILGDLTDAENEAVFDMLDSGKETATYDGVRNDVVQEAADKLRVKYSQYYDAINDVLVAHGYPEIGFIKNYAPHRQPEQMQSAMSIFEKLGLSETVNELPTELAGRTDIFKPGKKWNPYFLHRTGEEAAQDAVGGFLSYLNYMSEVLYHVDDIQKVRTFGDQIRYLYGDEGLKADYDAARADTTLNEQEKELELARIRERQTDNSKMGSYVSHLDDFANIIAGKQAKWDRAVEGVDRRLLNVLQKPVHVLVQSSIPGNISSAINQTVQLPWLTAEAGEGNVLQAAFELLGGKLKREGFAGQSDFITGKRGAETYNAMKDKTAGEKVLDAASIPFEVMDDVTSQVIVRAFYLKNVKAGMEHEAALRKADKQAERLVGSRMKGAKPDIFSVKSLKLLTTFQLEVANQWQHLKFDLPQEYREIERTRGTAAAKAEAVKRITKGAIYTFALNSLIEQITGNKPAGFDIIGAIWDYIQAGLPGEDEEEQAFDPEAGLKDLKKAAVEDLPFVGNIGALLGIGDGRLPLPSVDWENIQAGREKKRNAETKEEKDAGKRQIRGALLKSAATMLPMGNQIKKTIQGTSDVVRGGRYTNDGTQLMYEVEQNVPNAIRGALFGRNALPETREYWDKGKSPALSKKQTEQMEQAKAYGIDQGVYVDFVNTAKTLESDKDENGKTVDGSLARKKTELIDSLDITGEQKLQLYLDNVASDSKREDAEAMRDAGMTWDEILPALGSEKEQRDAVASSERIGEETKREVVRSMLDEDLWEEFDRCVDAGVKTEDFVQTRDFYSTAYADKDANGKSIRDSKKKKVWGFINGLDATPAQKDALSVACGYDSKLNEAPWHTGKVTLPGLPLPEVSGKAEQLLQLPMAEEKKPILMLP